MNDHILEGDDDYDEWLWHDSGWNVARYTACWFGGHTCDIRIL